MNPILRAVSLVLMSFVGSSAFGAVKTTSVSKSDTPKLETATLAAGCFWGVEKFFGDMPGVIQTKVGYEGGKGSNPTYHKVSEGDTGYAETVEIQFDPSKISYETLLDKFFKMHDPTTKNRQINDVGTQYRSAIFTNSPEQEKVARAYKAKVEKSGAWKAPITTEISPASRFYPAEPEHQKYLERNVGGYDNHYLRTISFDSAK